MRFVDCEGGGGAGAEGQRGGCGYGRVESREWCWQEAPIRGCEADGGWPWRARLIQVRRSGSGSICTRGPSIRTA